MQPPSPRATIPNTRSERWDVLREVTAQWYPPLESRHGTPDSELDAAQTRLGIAIPQSLREWHRLSGLRKDIWSQQDFFFSPDEFEIKQDYLVFMTENQCVNDWGIRVDDLHLEDPPVYTSSVDDPAVWFQVNDTVSQFALQMFAYSLKFSHTRRWWANAHIDRDAIECLAANYPRLPFPEWDSLIPIKFFGVGDLLIELQTENNDEHAWMYVAARKTAAVESFLSFVDHLDIDYNACSDDWPPGWVSASDDLE